MEADVSSDPEDVSLLGAVAVAAQAREPADAVQEFRRDLYPLTGVEERWYCDRGQVGGGGKRCKETVRAGVECEVLKGGRPLQL